jgi:Fe-S-cluster containining protein
MYLLEVFNPRFDMDAENEKNKTENVAKALVKTIAEIERGLRFSHVMMSVNSDQGNEAVAYVQALADVLVEKGILTHEELEKPLERAREEIAQIVMPRVRLMDIGDKYTDTNAVDIDCASLIHLCRGRCCSFKFFLTKQDLDEGAARWDYGNPYWIKQARDGYCVHSDVQTRACTIHAKRPHVCRQFDCRQDKRIWIDFERRIPAPLMFVSGDAPVAMAEVALQNMMLTSEDNDTDLE